MKTQIPSLTHQNRSELGELCSLARFPSKVHAQFSQLLIVFSALKD